LRAVEQLASGYRIVFLLHDMQGYEHEEIGKMLGVSAGTSKSQLHKARKRLRELLLKETEKNDS
jgi:RNA polymerase sigma-70 factor (ECF subfamily)